MRQIDIDEVRRFEVWQATLGYILTSVKLFFVVTVVVIETVTIYAAHGLLPETVYGESRCTSEENVSRTSLANYMVSEEIDDRRMMWQHGQVLIKVVAKG